MNELKKFQKNKNENIQAMSGDNDLKRKSLDWISARKV